MKVAQIGVGGWGKNHSRVLSEFGVLSAVCDTNSQRAEEFGKKYSVNFYSSFENLLDQEEFDAAYASHYCDSEICPRCGINEVDEIVLGGTECWECFQEH